eukprot:EG_transcript_11218
MFALLSGAVLAALWAAAGPLRAVTPRSHPVRRMAMAASGGQVQTVPAADFFEHLFGFKEDVSNPQAVYAAVAVDHAAPGGAVLRSSVNGRSFRAGALQLCSLLDLQRQVRLPAAQPGTLSLVIGEGSRGSNVRLVDVGALQADPENCGATFQVASNFNCLEFVGPHDSAANGISKYVHDLTQGPAASISCAPACLYRNYFVRHSHRGVQYEGQLQRQLNLLGDLPLDVVNGYVRLVGASLDHVAAVAADPAKYFALARVGLHNDVQVTSGLKGAAVELCPDEAQTVHQVFTAALDLAGLPGRASPEVVAVARLLLAVAYRLTLLAGVANSQRQQGRADRPGRDRLFLTLIGGGVFANDMGWIYDAIRENQDLILQSGLDVRLTVYNRRSLSAAHLGAFEQLARATGGTVTAAR